MMQLPVQKLWLCTETIDGRKGVAGLIALVQGFEKDPCDQSCYIFLTRSKKIIKILYYDKTGFWMFYKKINEKTFFSRFKEEGLEELDSDQLQWLLQGLSIYQKRAFAKSHPEIL